MLPRCTRKTRLMMQRYNNRKATCKSGFPHGGFNPPCGKLNLEKWLNMCDLCISKAQIWALV